MTCFLGEGSHNTTITPLLLGFTDLKFSLLLLQCTEVRYGSTIRYAGKRVNKPNLYLTGALVPLCLEVL